MTEVGRELSELKTEIVEARNQAIKTDNQVKNVALDVKAFERRFDALEKRTRMASIAAHGIVALTIAAAAYLITNIRSGIYEDELTKLTAEAREAKVLAETGRKQLDTRLAQLTESQEKHERAAGTLAKLLNHLDNRRDREAADLLTELDISALSSLERRLVEKRLTELRVRAAETAYRAARAHLGAARHDAALTELQRCIDLEPNGPFSRKSIYLQATTLYALKRYAAAEAPLKKLHEAAGDDSYLDDEVRFMLGTTLAQLDKKEPAKKLLEQSSSSGRFQAAARLYLSALKEGKPLPNDTSTRKRRTVAAD